MPTDASKFIARWAESAASERANYQLFLTELCDLLGVDRPSPSAADDAKNEYVFEKSVTFRNPDDTTSTGRIDLYRKGHFVCETKQGSEAKRDGSDALAAPRGPARKGHGIRGSQTWDANMIAARGQAEGYVRALPDDNPPFLLVVDVGYSIELYSDFSRLGKIYTPFPDARSHRICVKHRKQPTRCAEIQLFPQKCRKSFFQANMITSLTFPNRQNMPPLPLKFPPLPTIAVPIAHSFFLPELGVCFWDYTTPWARMHVPITSVNKYNFL